jgi:transcriptional regulator
MYIPPHFREERLEVMHELMQSHSLATLVTIGSSGLNANHIPMLLDPAPGPYGTLRGHVARANPVWRELQPDIAALAIFTGPDCYISPSWYDTKREGGKVVPTWNYATVHAYGVLEIFHEAERLREIVRTLTEVNEAGLSHPWSIDDAPPGYIDGLLNGIVGIQMKIERLEAKWKVSQNRPPADRASAGAALDALGTDSARQMSALIRGRSE